MVHSAALLGGDRRQVYLAQLLLRDGWMISTWGMEKGDAPNGVPLHRALAADTIILPLPVCRNGQLNLPLTDLTLDAERLWSSLRRDQLLLGGMTGPLSARLMQEYGLTLLDYYQREEVQIANAVPTAEGAIRLAMEATAGTVHGCRCLVIGYGRIGKVLSRRLDALGADVTVAARRYSDLAWIDAMGYRRLHTRALAGALGDFALIFNTVPSPILDGGLLRELGADSVVIELASAPGGVDRDAARQLARRVIDAPGLPGSAAPAAAAAAIRDGICHILEERGEQL